MKLLKKLIVVVVILTVFVGCDIFNNLFGDDDEQNPSVDLNLLKSDELLSSMKVEPVNDGYIMDDILTDTLGIGEIGYIDADTAVPMLSYNHPLLNTYDSGISPYDIYTNILLANYNKIVATDLNEIVESNIEFTAAELPDFPVNGMIIKDNILYSYGIAPEDLDGITYDYYFIYDIVLEQINIKFTMYIENYTITLDSVLYKDGDKLVNIMAELYSSDEEPDTVEGYYYSGFSFKDGDDVLSLRYNNNGMEKRRDFSITNGSGTMSAGMNNGTSNDVPVTFLSTDFYNVDGNFIAYRKDFESFDLQELDLSNMDQLIIDSEKFYALKNILPLKVEYSSKYDFIKLNRNPEIGRFYNYYLFDNSRTIAAYTTGTAEDYINSIIDTDLDIVMDINENGDYVNEDSNGEINTYYEITSDVSYFAGPAIAVVADLEAEFSVMYKKHWSEVVDYVFDYDKMILSSNVSTVLSGLKE